MKRCSKIIAITMVLLLALTFTLAYVGGAAKVYYSADYTNTYKNTGDQKTDIAEVAKTQIGYKEGEGTDDDGNYYTNATKYGAWMTDYLQWGYDFTYTAWCGMFIAWCADQAGIPSSTVPYSASCDNMAAGFKKENMHYNGDGYIPQPGDIVFFSNVNPNEKSSFDHVGIVVSVSADQKTVTTVEGNYSDKVSQNTRPVYGLYWGQYSVAYASPDYKTADTDIKVTGVELSETLAELTVGDTKTLRATVVPENAADKTVTYTSDKPEIASVSADGRITAKTAGTALITVTTSDGNFKKTCTVTVKDADVKVSGILLSDSEKALKQGETFTLKATVKPSDAANQTVTFSSDNESVATVSQNGVVTAVKAGEAVITAVTEDGGFKASCTVTVAEQESGGKDDGSTDEEGTTNPGDETPDEAQNVVKQLIQQIKDYFKSFAEGPGKTIFSFIYNLISTIISSFAK